MHSDCIFGHEVVLVSSGAIAAGLVRLNLAERPREIHLSQAAAAVGQSALVRAYEDCLGPHGVVTAQILLSHADVRILGRLFVTVSLPCKAIDDSNRANR